MVQMFVRTVVRMRVIVSYSLLFISILLIIYIYLAQYFFVRISVSCLTLFFLVLLRLFFCFIYPLPMLRHADRTALFQRFAVVCVVLTCVPILGRV